MQLIKLKEENKHARFEVPSAVLLKIQIFLDVTLYL